MKQPCYKCPDREFGCHGRCEQYKAYRAEMDALKAKRKAESEVVDAIMEARNRRHKYFWNRG